MSFPRKRESSMAANFFERLLSVHISTETRRDSAAGTCLGYRYNEEYNRSLDVFSFIRV